MSTTVDDIQRGHRHYKLVGGLSSQLSKVLVKRNAAGDRASAGSGERDSEDGVGTNLLLDPAILILSTINLLNHLAVNSLLLRDIHALESRREDLVDVLDSLQAALTKEATSVLVAKLQSLVDASGGTRGDSCAEALSVAGEHVGLYCGVAARVDDFAGAHRRDSGEVSTGDASEASAGDVGEHAVCVGKILVLDYIWSASFISHISCDDVIRTHIFNIRSAPPKKP